MPGQNYLWLLRQRPFLLLISAEILLVILGLYVSVVPAVAVAGLAAAVWALYYFYKNPVWLLLTLLFSIHLGYLGDVQIGGKVPNIVIAELVSVFLYFIFALKLMQGWPKPTLLPPGTVAFAVFLCLGLAVSLTAFDVLRAIVVFRIYLLGLICYLFSYNVVDTNKKFNLLIAALLLWGVVLVLNQLYILFSFGGLSNGLVAIVVRKRFMSNTWGSSNYFAAFFVLILPLVVGKIVSAATKAVKLRATALLLLLATGLLLTLSRGGFLASVAGLLVFAALVMKPRNIASLLLVTAIVGVILVLNPVSQVFFSNLSDFDKTSSFFSRVNVYNDLINMISANPFWGVGWGNLGFNLVSRSSGIISAHNIVLGLISEVGLFAFIAFVALLVMVIAVPARVILSRYATAVRITAVTAISIYTGAITHAMLEPNFEALQFSIVFWITAGAFTRYLMGSANFSKATLA